MEKKCASIHPEVAITIEILVAGISTGVGRSGVTLTYLVSESNLFRAGLKHILADTKFQVEIEASAVGELQFRGMDDGCDDKLVIIRKPADIKEIEQEIIQLNQPQKSCRIIILAGSMVTEQMAIGFASGADGYLLEDISGEALLESLNLVMLGEKVFPSQLAAMLTGEMMARNSVRCAAFHDDLLSERELDIVQLLANGMPNKVIARDLEISEATVKVHLKSILKKLNVANRTQAAIWALNNGLTPPSELVTAQ